MPSQREIVLEEDISGPGGEAELAGWLVHKMGIVGKAGCPDRWHWRKGVLVIIEYKKKNKPLDGRQVKRIDEFQRAGFKVHRIDNHDAARRVLKLGQYAE